MARRGRPSIRRGEKSFPITVRVPASDYDAYYSAARLARTSIPAIVRMRLRIPSPDADSRRLRVISRLLTRLAVLRDAINATEAELAAHDEARKFRDQNTGSSARGPHSPSFVRNIWDC